LHEIDLLHELTFRGNGVRGRAEPAERSRVDGLTSIVPGWPSLDIAVRERGSLSEVWKL